MPSTLQFKKTYGEGVRIIILDVYDSMSLVISRPAHMHFLSKEKKKEECDRVLWAHDRPIRDERHRSDWLINEPVCYVDRWIEDLRSVPNATRSNPSC
jgi:hypothetical protein